MAASNPVKDLIDELVGNGDITQAEATAVLKQLSETGYGSSLEELRELVGDAILWPTYDLPVDANRKFKVKVKLGKALKEAKNEESELRALEERLTSRISSTVSPMRRGLEAIRGEMRALGARYAHSASSTREQYLSFANSLHFQKGVPLWFALSAGPVVGTDGQPLFGNFKPPLASEKGEVQDWWTSVLSRTPLLKQKAVDRHEYVSVGTRKPDTVFYVAGKTDSVFDIVALGDNKGRRRQGESDFTNEEKGQMVEMLIALFKEQPWRNSATGYLSDGLYIQFFRLSRTNPNSELDLAESTVLSLAEDGAKAFMGLLTTPSSQLGHSLPDVKLKGSQISLEAFLGEGGSSFVYKGTLGSQQYVVKNFKAIPEAAVHLNTEAANLKKLAKLFPNVPRLEGRSDDGKTLLLSPVGIPFALAETEVVAALTGYGNNTDPRLITAKHFDELLNILEAAHNQGLVHRDVALHNMFLRETKSEEEILFLNDWGCAAQMGVAVPFAGSLSNASRRILVALEKAQRSGKPKSDVSLKPLPTDDLESVVCCVFQAVSANKYRALLQWQDRPDKIRAFWNDHLAPVRWSEMLTVARKGQYRELSRLISDILA